MSATKAGPVERSPVLELHELAKSFREGSSSRRVLQRASLQLAAGECVALLGPSGSGKSTLLHLAAGIDTPDAGSVRVCGLALERLSERERSLLRRERVGLVFQSFHLLPGLSALENACLSLELNGRHAEHARARELLARVGLAGREHARPAQLSGGEQQRVALARALAHEPSLLLADEPTGSLDAASGALVLQLLLELARERGLALLFATHSHELALRADRRLELHEGALVQLPAAPRAQPAGSSAAR
jgi:putative ABC transport system ATP-binding protein